jgi:hypothetical protein
MTDELFLSLLEEEEMDSYHATEKFDELLQAELEEEIQTAIDRHLEAQCKAFYENETTTITSTGKRTRQPRSLQMSVFGRRSTAR